MQTLEFYTTAGCHLCEEAAMLCQPLIEQGLIAIHSIDIAESETLVEQYGIRIPVLKRCHDGAELGWPFDADGLLRFIQG